MSWRLRVMVVTGKTGTEEGRKLSWATVAMRED